MPKPKLYYFDAPVSRGEECRLALHLASVEFEDIRVKLEDWPALKPKTPFGGLPFLEVSGRPALGQTNAILVYVGRNHDLHPRDDFEAARHEAVLQHAEDLRATLGPSLRAKDPDARKRGREAFVETYLPDWAARLERQIDETGPFFAGEKLHVVDIKLHRIVHWFTSGTVDHVPTTVFSGHPKLLRVYDTFRQDSRVQAWYAKTEWRAAPVLS